MLLQGWIEHEAEFLNPVVDREAEVQQNGRSMGIKEHLDLEHPKVIPQPFPVAIVGEGVGNHETGLCAFNKQ